MPDSKITALTSISTSTDPANDPLVIVDVSDTSMAATGTTKKVTLNQLLGASGTATLASATITGDLTVDTSTLKVDSANDRVGIGIATPAWPLDIRSATAVAQILSTTGTNAAYLQVSNTGGIFYLGRENSAGTSFASPAYSAVLYAGGAYPLVTTVNGSERYRIASDGVATWSNVGGVAGTAMTLNATGLGVGDAPASNTRLTVAAASRLADTTGQAYIRSTDAQAQDIGAQLTLGGLFNASAHYAFGGIAGRKENSTSGNVAGYLDFLTTTSGGSLTSRMRIDSTGNVGIGVTPSARFHSKAGAVTQGGIIETSGANALLSFADAGTSSYTRVQIGSSGNNLVAFINSVQAMTLDASGNLLVGKSSASATTIGFEGRANGTVNSTLASSVDANATYAAYSTGAAAYRFYVGMGGTVYATNTTISAISDARLKENVQDIDVGLGAILALKPRKFDWKEGKGKNIKGDRGFIAQEFEQVFPQLVDEWKDEAPEGEAPYKSVRQDLIPVLVKAIQELAAEVNALKNA